MADPRRGPPDNSAAGGAGARLAPDVRERLIGLLTAELVAAWDAALAAGADRTRLVEIVAARRRALHAARYPGRDPDR